jgi:hypothetical protein
LKSAYSAYSDISPFPVSTLSVSSDTIERPYLFTNGINFIKALLVSAFMPYGMLSQYSVRHKPFQIFIPRNSMKYRPMTKFMGIRIINHVPLIPTSKQKPETRPQHYQIMIMLRAGFVLKNHLLQSIWPLHSISFLHRFCCCLLHLIGIYQSNRRSLNARPQRFATYCRALSYMTAYRHSPAPCCQTARSLATRELLCKLLTRGVFYRLSKSRRLNSAAMSP